MSARPKHAKVKKPDATARELRDRLWDLVMSRGGRLEDLEKALSNDEDLKRGMESLRETTIVEVPAFQCTMSELGQLIEDADGYTVASNTVGNVLAMAGQYLDPDKALAYHEREMQRHAECAARIQAKQREG